MFSSTKLALMLSLVVVTPASALVCLEASARPDHGSFLYCPVFLAAKTALKDYVGPKPDIEGKPWHWTTPVGGRSTARIEFDVLIDNGEASRGLLSNDAAFSTVAESFTDILMHEFCDPGYRHGALVRDRVVDLRIKVRLNETTGEKPKANSMKEILVQLESCEAN
jgi:hypothetical protein